MDQDESIGRIAIRLLRPDLGDNEHDEIEMARIGTAAGYIVPDDVVTIDPDVEGPLVTVVDAIAHSRANAVIVRDLERLDGIVADVLKRVRILTLAGQCALKHTHTGASA